MKKYIKPFFMLVFLIMLGIILAVSHYQESITVLGNSIVTSQELAPLFAGKQMAATPPDLLLYQGQPIPYQKDTNTFLLPVSDPDETENLLSTNDYGEIYLFPNDGSSDLTVYVVDDTEYYQASVIFTSSIILTFQTEAFENETAYGVMNFYTPSDSEIDTYSFKSSDAKLSYESSDQLLSSSERNYQLKLTQEIEGEKIQHKMNLANLRKDDDWELDPLMGYSDQILQFYELWNKYCMTSGQERFAISCSTVEFYLDEHFMGTYLLRVPIDDKQLNHADGLWLTEADTSTAIFYQEIQSFLDSTVSDFPLYLEYYYRQEDTENSSVVYALPRRFRKIIEQP